jgi:hypothetical protein
MWTCCILHNLLLRHDGLEFLWIDGVLWCLCFSSYHLTPCTSQVTSWHLEDPDSEQREDFDGPPIELRANRRMQARFFQRNSTGDLVDAAVDGPGIDPSHEVEDEPGVHDNSVTELQDEHIDLRERLVKQFEIRYKRNEVKWLNFPRRPTEVAQPA